MAKIDALLQHMIHRGATHAMLRADAPAALESSAGITQGQPLSGAQIEAMLNEIMPVEARQNLQADGFTAFTYQLPTGMAPDNAFNFEASRPNGQWKLEIRPSEVPFPSATPLSSVEAGAQDASNVQLAKPESPPPFDPSAENVATTPAPPSGNHPSGAPNSNVTNDSGMGDASVLPAELQGFNWGALFGSWIWGLGNSVWLGLLCLVPCVGFFMRFYLGSKGNELAWKSKRWDSVQSFRSAQTTWAIVGIALIGVSLFMGLITSAVLFPVFARARENARRASCQSNMKMISLAALQYGQAHNNKLPTGTTMAQWKPQLAPYIGGNQESWQCPNHTGTGESYQLNPDISGVNIDKIDDLSQTPMFYESQDDLHLDGSNIAFADGHIKWFWNDNAQDVIKGNP